MTITNEQKKTIHTLKNALSMDDETYRETLWLGYKVESSVKLTRRQARELIDTLKKSAVQAGRWQNNRSFRKYKYDNLGYRDGMASPRQLRMIEALWKDVSFVQDEQARLEALEVFLSNHFGVDKIIWIEATMVGKIKKTLEQMKAQKAQKEEK